MILNQNKNEFKITSLDETEQMGDDFKYIWACISPSENKNITGLLFIELELIPLNKEISFPQLAHLTY